VSRSTQGRSEGPGLGSVRETGWGSDPGSSDEISLSHLIRVFRRRRRIIVASVIVVFLLGALYCILKTPRYEAVADLAINPEGSNALDMGDITASLGGGGLGFDEKLETQVHILKSKSLAWTVISELRLDKEPTFASGPKFFFFGPLDCSDHPDQIERISPECRNAILKKFSKSLTVLTIPRTQAVEITFRNANPTLAREIVNHIASAYTQRTFMTRYEDTMKASNWLSGQMDQLKSKVEESQNKLSKFQKQTGIFGTDENNNLVLSKLDDLSKELTDAEADRILKEAQYRVAQSGNPELIGTIVPDSVLPVLRGQEADLKSQLAQATSEYGPQYPAVIQLGNQLAQVEKSLQKEIADIQERFHTDYQVSAGTEKQMRAAFDQQKQMAYDMSEGLDQYGILKREVESNNDLYDDLQKKLNEAGVLASLKAATVDVIDLATLPTKPIEPDIPLVLVLSIIFGLGAGIGLAFVAENMDTSIRSSEEIEALTSIPIFGIIPHIKLGRPKPKPQAGETNAEGSADPALVTLQRPKSQAAEAFRALRTAILLASAGTPPKTILITSATPEEGKTVTSMNISIVLNQEGRRVLLVDADLRRGTMAVKWNIPKNFGLSGALTGAGNWRDVVVDLPEVPNLFLLQSGLRPPNSSELLGSTQMHQLLEEWKAEYDHVIIDSAPSLLVTDAVLIAQWVDMVLLVSRIGLTSRIGLRRACELLHTGNANISGIVANDTGAGDHYYGYGYGYGSNKGYYSEEEG
jgi:capsular exopolysaccharide synthesis family protein